MPSVDLYPDGAAARDRFVLERRGGRDRHDPWRYQDVLVEEERTEEGLSAAVATVFLTGRECPWRCAMCDLWRYTTVDDTPPGAIATQVSAARAALGGENTPATVMKLYNAGSFFDPRAVPPGDYDGVASAVSGLSRVVVESHPALIGSRVDQFLEALGRHNVDGSPPPKLEVAMGLETAHEGALDRLNKRFTLDEFAAAAAALHNRGVGLRVFLLIFPPFVPQEDQDAWLLRSLDAAFACGASVVSLVPTRSGNGAMEALAATGGFHPPDLDDIERSVGVALAHAGGRGRVFVDLWDLDRFARCAHCLAPRRERLHSMNLQQRILPPHRCGVGHPAVVQ